MHVNPGSLNTAYSPLSQAKVSLDAANKRDAPPGILLGSMGFYEALSVYLL